VQRARVTIQDVAREAGVSTATVSRVLNGSPSVDGDLARRVRAAVAATSYVLNSTGRALRRQVSDVWAIIVSDLQNPFFTAMVAALEPVAARRGVSVMLCSSDEQLDRERAYVQAAIAQRMAGVVVVAASEVHSDLTPLSAAGIPTVLVDRRIQGFAGDSVVVDNRDAGRQAAVHLVQAGHDRIACIAGSSDVSTTEDRLIGFREGLAEAGHDPRRLVLRRSDLRAEGGEVAMRTLLADRRPPDAVFATNGPLTAGAFRAVQRLGTPMPDGVALLGVDDDQWTRMVDPPVSVVQQPVAQMGAIAAELLLARSADPGAPFQHVVLPAQLLVRGSTAPRRPPVVPEG